jgi:hypothetical protein
MFGSLAAALADYQPKTSNSWRGKKREEILVFLVESGMVVFGRGAVTKVP